jgi:hypothetical protein
VNLTGLHVAVLTALRGATVLQREPKTLTPDGHEHWWTLAELADEARFEDWAYRQTALSSATRGLYKHHLVAVRTIQTVTRWSITGEGLLALAEYEAAAGLSDVVAAEMDVDQAQEDIRQARTRLRAAEERLVDAQEALAARSKS